MATPAVYTPGVPETEKAPRLVILDSHGILFRAFFAFANSDHPLMTSKGELTFATHGYAETLIRVLDQLSPTHICAAWDAPGKTFRHEASEEYKATRRETPSELLVQMRRVREMLDAFGIPIFEYPGYEADDVAGTLARKTAEQGIQTYIATLDTDLVQLIGPKVNLFMFRPYQRDTIDYNEQRAAERYGFSPIYMIDFKALKGDTSDNIEGIKGIGEKTATSLIREYGTVESIYEHIDDIKGAVKTKLAENHERAIANKDLVTIRTDLDIDFDFEACRVKNFDREKIADFFRDLEFRMLAARLDEVLGTATAGAAAADTAETLYELVTSADELEAVAAAIREAGTVSVNTFSTAGEEVGEMLLGISVATAPGRAWYVPVGHAPRLDDESQQLPLQQVRDVLGPLFADPRITKSAYSAKYVKHQLDKAGMAFEGTDFDASIVAFLLGETSSTLAPLVNERLGIQIATPVTLTGSGRKASPLAQVEMEQVMLSACQYADMVLRLRPELERQLEERELVSLYRDIELPLMPVLFEMERVGVHMDPEVLRQISTTMVGDIDRAEQAVYEEVGHEFNIGSPKALSDVLFGEMGMPKTRKTALGYSTDQRALESLKATAPVIDKIFEWRALTKLKSTYLDALPATIGADGRIHTDMQQTVAATGRLSSTNPNLQNIPVRTDMGRDIRRAFLASNFPKPVLVAGDYSQIELRVLAHVTGDKGLVDAFLDDQDIHRTTAATVFSVKPEDVTRQMRDIAKMVNFGIAYGMGEFGLASRTDLTREQAADFIKSYYTKFPGIKDWQEATLTATKNRGYGETLFGRRRYLPAIHSSNFQVRSAAEREAINMPIQGTAADIIKIAMIRIADAMRERELSSRMILQVHDELIFECPDDEAKAVSDMCLEIMPASLEMKVPLKVDMKQGPNWALMEAVG
jgi:DNA polymerase-1